MESHTTLTMVTVIMTAAFMVTSLVWQQQQTQAQSESESSSTTTCINDQPCHTSSVSNSNSTTPDSSKSNHNKIHMSTTCINDQPCHTSVSNSTKSPSQNYPPVDDDIAGLIDGITS
jgi:hypothetical protein